MTKIVSRAVGLFALAGAAISAQAIVIDDFTSGAYSITANSVNPQAEAVRNGTMLGGQRDALVQYLSGPLSVTAQVVIGGGGAQFYNEASETNGVLTLQYDGFDGEVEDGVLNPGTNLGGNFSLGNSFDLFFPFIDAGLGSQVNLTITVVTGGGTATHSANINNGTNIMHSVAFGNFAGVDWSNVQRVDFRFQSPTAADFTLDSIRVNVIPGPAALLPFLAGMAGLARKRRRK
ncbi:MAG TPA: PTPA-CTERM sorting domain-containing protein [Fimbriimonadaceae bacterium]|nr:PTPA-CTERM sorting domain-containing protein [Fimbriimonadaceae bacterium]